MEKNSHREEEDQYLRRKTVERNKFPAKLQACRNKQKVCFQETTHAIL